MDEFTAPADHDWIRVPVRHGGRIRAAVSTEQALLRIDDVDLWVTPVDEYTPGIWQVRTEMGTEFLVSTHVLIVPRGEVD